jgi:hypothetical protein
MKTLKIAKYALVSFMAIQLTSCDNKENADPLFSKTPSERISDKENELKTLLNNSEYGWKAVYFTDDKKYGGFTFLFKFNQDMTVEMASDLKNPDLPDQTPEIEAKKTTSLYDLQLGSTMSLVFTTKNNIHLLSDSNNSPLVKGKGLEGDFQFLYYGQDKEELVFKTNRKLKELRFIKATKEDWDNLAKNITMRTNLEKRNELYQVLETNDGKDTHQLDLNFNSITRFAAPYSTDPDYDKSYDMAIQYTTTGLKIVPAIEISNQKISDFKFDQITGNFVATGINNVSATIKFQNAPLVITDDYNIILPGNPTKVFAYIYNLTNSAPTNSELFTSILKNTLAKLPAGVIITRIQPWFNNPNGSNYVEYRLANSTSPTVTISRYYHYFNVTADTQNKIVKLNPLSWKTSTASSAPSIVMPGFLKELDEQLMNPKGIYFIEQQGLGYKAYTLTSVSQPFRMTLYSFQ